MYIYPQGYRVRRKKKKRNIACMSYTTYTHERTCIAYATNRCESRKPTSLALQTPMEAKLQGSTFIISLSYLLQWWFRLRWSSRKSTRMCPSYPTLFPHSMGQKEKKKRVVSGAMRPHEGKGGRRKGEKNASLTCPCDTEGRGEPFSFRRHYFTFFFF